MTLNRYRLKRLKDSGHPAAIRASKLLDQPDRLIGLILLGNNFVNIFASSISTIIAIRMGGNSAIAMSAGLLTFVILIFAEVTPKTLAAISPEKLAFPASFIFIPLLKILSPLVWVVNLFANQLLKLLGVNTKEFNSHALDSEELRAAVNEAGALIPDRHQKMLLGILDLEKTTVDNIMVPRNDIDALDINDSIDDLTEQLRNMPYTRMVVFDDTLDNILGFIHSRKLMQYMLNDTLTHEIIRDICRQPYYIPETTPLNTQLLEFQRLRRRLALVVDEYGDIQGLLTMADLLGEIVGEIATDPLPLSHKIHQSDDGTWQVSGNISIKELERMTGYQFDIDEDGPVTLSGLIVDRLESIPQPGITLLIDKHPIEISQTHENRVKMAIIRPAIDETITE